MGDNGLVHIPSQEQESLPALPRIVIVEQPAMTATRFRYESEDRAGGQVIGRNSTTEKPTYFEIKVDGYDGSKEILIVASCVIEDQPYRAHPHNLVGPNCEGGIYKKHLDKKTMSRTFPNLGIQCVKKNKKTVEASLRLREQKKVDPFRLGFDHASENNYFNFNCVRICVQGFIVGGNTWTVLEPVVSDPIYDKRSISSTQIQRLSHASTSAAGGTEIIILCEKVLDKEVKVLFSEKSTRWHAYGEIISIYKQNALVVKTPRYEGPNVNETVKAEVRLIRLVDKAAGKPLNFMFTTEEPDPLRHKRPRIHNFFGDVLQQLTNPNLQPLTEVPTTSTDLRFLQPQHEASTFWTDIRGFPSNCSNEIANFSPIQSDQSQSSVNTIDSSHAEIRQGQEDITQSSDTVGGVDTEDLLPREDLLSSEEFGYIVDELGDELSLSMNLSDNE